MTILYRLVEFVAALVFGLCAVILLAIRLATVTVFYCSGLLLAACIIGGLGIWLFGG